MKKKTYVRAALFIGILLLTTVFSACGKEEVVENPLDAGTFDANGNFIQLNWFPKAKMNSFDDAQWITENGFRLYGGKEYRSYVGIDVSSNQQVVDWDRVKAAGVDYAIMRAGYRTYGSGVIMADEFCYWNLLEAKRVGIKVGVYFFSQAIDEEEAKQEAKFVIDTIGHCDLDLPIYYDTEEITYDTARTDNLSGEQFTDNAIAFCEAIKKAGYEPGIYANQMWLCNKLDYMRLEKYNIWLAKYADVLNYPYAIEAWQYSNEGQVDGIGPVVDLNIIFEKK